MARTNGSEHLRYRYGICLNDQCSKCKSKEVQTILARKDFVCEECGKQLRECPPPVSFWGKYGKMIIAAGVVVVIAAIVGLVFALSGNNTPKSLDISESSITLKEGESKKLEVLQLKEEKYEGLKLEWEAESSDNSKAVEVTQDGEVKALHKGKATVIVCLADNEDVKAECEVVVEAKEQVAEEKPIVEENTEQTTPATDTTEPVAKAEPAKKEPVQKTSTTATSKTANYGTVKLGYGTYTGDLKNGKPHGHGTITYTSSHKIVSSKDFVASPGDRFEGDFREGKIASIGYWYHGSEQTAVKP